MDGIESFSLPDDAAADDESASPVHTLGQRSAAPPKPQPTEPPPPPTQGPATSDLPAPPVAAPPAAPSPASASTTTDAPSTAGDDARESKPRRSFAEINAESTCQEVHATEASYVEDMRLMLTTYERPARILCLTLEQKNAIFSNIEGLLQCNRELLRHLEADGDPVEVLARAFLAVAPFFRLYAE